MTEKDYFSLIKQEQLNKAIEELKRKEISEGFLNLIDYNSPYIHQFKYKETNKISENSSYEEWVYYIISYYGYFDNDDGLQFRLDVENGNLLKILLMLQNKIKKAE